MAEELIGRLALDSLGAELVSTAGGSIRARIYLGASCPADPVLSSARAVLADHGLDPEACALGLERLEDQRWVERYQASLRPFRLGRRFVVSPGGGVAEPGRRRPILLVPGRAFGTGDHPTTRLCVEALERHVREGSRWLDLGCGSGILSIVARHCGASRVLAIDRDAESVRVAREVLRSNALEGEVELRCGSDSDRLPGCWDGVVVNIGAGFFTERSARLRRLLGPEGMLLASGFTVEERAAVSQALERAGLAVCEERCRTPWVLLRARRGV